MKPGWHSSEFWVLVLYVLLTNLQVSGLFESAHWSLKVITMVVNILGFFGYSAQRARLKLAAVVAGTANPPEAASPGDSGKAPGAVL